MDPNAPNYDRPPTKKRRLPPWMQGQAKNRMAPNKPVRPPVATDNAAPSINGVAIGTPAPKSVQNLPPKSTLPSKGSLGNISQFKGKPNFQNAQGKQIGMYNATHKHGEPIKKLIAQLKARRSKGSTQRV
jgi:hypothetical protein